MILCKTNDKNVLYSLQTYNNLFNYIEVYNIIYIFQPCLIDFIPSYTLTHIFCNFRQKFQENEINGRFPVSHYWDESEPRLFVCETAPIGSEKSASAYSDLVDNGLQWSFVTFLALLAGFLTLWRFLSQEDVSVVTLFCTQEHGLLLQDCFSRPSGLQALLALDVPYYYFTCKVSSVTLCYCTWIMGQLLVKIISEMFWLCLYWGQMFCTIKTQYY